MLLVCSLQTDKRSPLLNSGIAPWAGVKAPIQRRLKGGREEKRIGLFMVHKNRTQQFVFSGEGEERGAEEVSAAPKRAVPAKSLPTGADSARDYELSNGGG